MSHSPHSLSLISIVCVWSRSSAHPFLPSPPAFWVKLFTGSCSSPLLYSTVEKKLNPVLTWSKWERNNSPSHWSPSAWEREQTEPCDHTEELLCKRYFEKIIKKHTLPLLLPHKIMGVFMRLYNHFKLCQCVLPIQKCHWATPDDICIDETCWMGLENCDIITLTGGHLQNRKCTVSCGARFMS